MSTPFHSKWRRGTAAERGAFSTSALATPFWWYETDTGYVWWWDGSSWTQVISLPISAADVEVEEIGTATYDDVQNWINNTQSAGRISGGAMTAHAPADGTLDIAAGTGFIKTSASDIGVSKFFDWDAASSLALVDGSVNYIYVDYNTGTEAITIAATTTRADIDGQTEFTLGRVYRDGNTLHIAQSGTNVYNHAWYNHQRLVEVRGFERGTGGVIAETGQRYLTATAGKFFLGANPITTAQQDTSGAERFTHWYNDGAWQDTTGQQQLGNTQYNDYGTGLDALTAADPYGVYWVFVHYDGDIHVVYGIDKYKLAEAENAILPPNLPDAVSCFAVLAAKIIFERNENNFTSVSSAYETVFPVSSPANHNDLGGLQGGAAGEYYHLTSAEETALANMAQGYILRGEAANIAAHDASTDHFVLVGDGTDIVSKAFDWDDVAAGAGADMAHAHTTAIEGGPTLGSTADPLTLTVANTGLHVQDVNDAFDMIIQPGGGYTANRVLQIVMGNAARQVTLTGNPTLDDWFDQSVKVAASPTFADVFVPDGGAVGVSANERIIFHTAGYIEMAGADVGIGTASPDNPLELLSTTTPQFRITHTDATDYATFSVDGDGQLDITTVDGGGAGGHICLLPDGNVGIGTTGPGYKLDVLTDHAGGYAAQFFNDGDNLNRYGVKIRCGQDLDAGSMYPIIFYDGDDTANGSISITNGIVSVNNRSDVSLKRDVQDTKGRGLDTILGLKVRDFRWKTCPDMELCTGFIAQEVKKVFPLAVNEMDGLKTVAPGLFMPMVVKAIQELEARLTQGGL